jgi:hypothetical protein
MTKKCGFYFDFGGVANRKSCGSEVGRSMYVSRESTKLFVAQCTLRGRVSILELDLMVEQGE